MTTRLDISQLRGRAPSRRTDSSRKWQIESGGHRTWITIELLPSNVVADPEAHERWMDAAVVESRPGLAGWEVFERLDAKSARGLGIAGQAVIAARRWVEGRSLGRTSSVSRWRDTGAAVAMALRELHDQGRYHGALKPSNIVMEGADVATLTDLPLSPAPYDDPTRLAAIAPYLAPECWEGDQAGPAADIYALGVMLGEFATGRRPLMANGLSGWSKAHTSGAPRTEHLRESGLLEIVDSMLRKDPDARPNADDVVGALIDLGADVSPPPVSALTSTIRQTARDCVERLSPGSPTHLTLGRAEQSRAASRLGRLVSDRLQLGGTPAIFVRRSSPEPGWPWTARENPWATLTEIARAVSRGRGRELRDISLRGDRSHIQREFFDLILGELPGDGLRVIWDGFDDEIADVRTLWRDLVEESVDAGRPLSTLTITDAPMPHAEPVTIESTAAAWDQWRRSTGRGDVRRMSSAAWREIVSRGSRGIDAMERALDEQLGARVESGQDGEGEQSDWRQRVGELHQNLAYLQACAVCHEQWERDDLTDADDVLSAWIDAASHVSEPSPACDALEDVLVAKLRADDTEVDAAIGLARMLRAQERGMEALQAINRAAPNTSLDRARVARWKAQINLDEGRYDDAVDAAEVGTATLTDDAPGELRRTLMLLERAARASNGESGAAEPLESALANYGAELEPSEKAQFYRCLGRARASSGELDAAVDAYRRALDVVDSAHLDQQIPKHRLRLGMAYHRRGQLGLAREQYDRALDDATDATADDTRALLHAQWANIDETLGALESAERHLWSARDLADRQHLDSVLVVCDLLEGDLYLAQGDVGRARECYRRALQGRRLTSPHQRAELDLAAADAALHDGDVDAARRLVDEARELIDDASVDALEPRLHIMRGKLELDGVEPSMSAIEEYRKGLTSALERHDLAQVLRHAPALAEVLRDEGIDELLAEVVDIHARARRGVATGLTRQLREQFERHAPALDGQPTQPAAAPKAPAQPQPERPVEQPTDRAASTGHADFRRLLGFNEVLFGAENPESLAEAAMDVAAMLFDDGLAAIVLDVDGVSHTTTSDGIGHADAVVELAGEVATVGQSRSVDASTDDRLGDNTTLLCVPLRDGKGLTGAIVLESDGALAGPRDLVDAFAHQVALAIRQMAGRAVLRADLEAAERAESTLKRSVEQLESRLESVESSEQAPEPATSGKPAPHTSKEMSSFLSQLERAASRQMPVELVGPAGARRETHARMLHDMGARRDGPFVVVDCGAFGEEALEIELFGEVTSRFERRGALALADRGTLFLDRIDRAPINIQSKLYRALHAGEYRPLGAGEAMAIDVRAVAGTASALLELVQSNSVHADLGHWLSADQLRIPPLSERTDDIPLLAADLLESLGSGLGRKMRLSAEAATVLRQARWPGDVRQLESVVRAAAAVTDGEVIDADTVRSLVDRASNRNAGAAETRGRKPKATRADVISAMQRAQDDRSRAAELLEVSERTLYRYLKKYELR